MIKIIKLITGENLISEVDDLNDKVRLNKPMMLGMNQERQLSMMKWLELSKEDNVMISKDMIVMMYEPINELTNGYQQQTGGIVTAPANVLNEKGKLVV